MILVTGASSGLGAAFARLYDAQGYKVLFTGRSKEKLSNIAKQLSTSADYKACDLTNYADVESLFDSLERTPNTIIHSAGSGHFGPIEEQDPQQIQLQIQNNLTTAINMIRETVKRYKDEPVNLVIIMSTAALSPRAEMSTYCAVKVAVKAMIESVRLELKGKPLNLIAVYPGGMATEFWDASNITLHAAELMSADDAAQMIKGALSNSDLGYISDITLSRKQ